MKKKLINSEAGKYTIYGALFGLSFPLLSLFIIFFITDNINTLVMIICTAPLFLGIFAGLAGKRQDNINEVNAGLEDLVLSRTQSIRNLMDVSGQGFLSFSSNLKINGEYSKACEDFLAVAPGTLQGQSIDILLFEDEEQRGDFREGLELFFSGKTKAEVIFDLMDKSLVLNDREIELDYKTISDNEVMLTLTDVTVQKELDRQLRREDDNRNIILQVINHKKYFSSFLNDAEELFSLTRLLSEKADTSDYHVLQRDLHTLKGNASFFNFNNTKSTAHEIEYLIADSLLLDEIIDLESQMSVLKKSYYSELAVVENALGREWMRDMDAVVIPQKQYLKLESYIKNKYAGDKSLYRAVEHFRKIPLSQMFIRFPDMAQRLSESLGKVIHPLEINGGQFPILPDKYESLINSFVHLLRNMIDHGIETTMDREMKNKDPQGTLSISLEARKGSILISFRDDGAGISFPAVERKAKELRLLDENDEADPKTLIKLIFSQNFSTADSVSEVSGRGVGLSAVKEEVERLNGKISVSSKPGQGCEFKILIPENALK